jgi:hypothetical protein
MILVNQVHRRVVGRHFGGGGDTTTAAVRVPIVEPDVGAGGEGRAWLSFLGPRGTPVMRPEHASIDRPLKFSQNETR